MLRRFDETDEDSLVDLDGDPAVTRFISGGRPTSRETVRTEILPKALGEYQVFAAFGGWAAVEKETDAFIGWFHLHPPEGGTGEEVELGYRLRRSAWGNGYATEGSRALVAKAFVELGVRRVFATTMTVNLASRRVMEKVGLALRSDLSPRLAGLHRGVGKRRRRVRDHTRRLGHPSPIGGSGLKRGPAPVGQPPVKSRRADSLGFAPRARAVDTGLTIRTAFTLAARHGPSVIGGRREGACEGDRRT